MFCVSGTAPRTRLPKLKVTKPEGALAPKPCWLAEPYPRALTCTVRTRSEAAERMGVPAWIAVEVWPLEMLMLTGEELLGLKLASPEYEAAMMWLPGARARDWSSVLEVELIRKVPSSSGAPASVSATLPVALPCPETPVTSTRTR